MGDFDEKEMGSQAHRFPFFILQYHGVEPCGSYHMVYYTFFLSSVS